MPPTEKRDQQSDRGIFSQRLQIDGLSHHGVKVAAHAIDIRFEAGK